MHCEEIPKILHYVCNFTFFKRKISHKNTFVSYLRISFKKHNFIVTISLLGLSILEIINLYVRFLYCFLCKFSFAFNKPDYQEMDFKYLFYASFQFDLFVRLLTQVLAAVLLFREKKEF